MKKRHSQLLGVVAAAAIFLAACGDDDDAGSTSETTAVPAETTGATTPETTAAGTSAATTTGSSATTAASTEDATGPADDSLEPIKIGWVNTDEGSPSFPDATDGILSGANYINAERNGINGHPIEIVTCSVGLDQESNQKCGQQFANDDDIDFVMTGLLLNGAPMYAALETAGKSAVIRNPLTSADLSLAPNVISYGGGVPAANQGTAEYFVDLGTIERVGVLATDSEVGRVGEQLMRPILDKAGIEATWVYVDESAPDFAAQVASLGDVDGVYIGLGPASCAQIAANEDTLFGPDVVKVGASTCVNSAVWNQVPNKQEGWEYLSADLSLDMGEGVDPDIDIFLEKYPEYTDAETPGRFSLSFWGQLQTVEQILESVGGADEITPASADAAFRDFTGPLMFGPEKVTCPGAQYPNVCIADTRVFRVQDGKVVWADPGTWIKFQ